LSKLLFVISSTAASRTPRSHTYANTSYSSLLFKGEYRAIFLYTVLPNKVFTKCPNFGKSEQRKSKFGSVGISIFSTGIQYVFVLKYRIQEKLSGAHCPALHCKSVPAQSQIWLTMRQSCLKWRTISHMWSIFCFTCGRYVSPFFWHMVCQICLKWSQQRIMWRIFYTTCVKCDFVPVPDLQCAKTIWYRNFKLLHFILFSC
jgi:hypothetical protein